jgi:hypothetical protein
LIIELVLYDIADNIIDTRQLRYPRTRIIPTAPDCSVVWTQIALDGNIFIFNDQVDLAYGPSPYDPINGTYNYINNVTGQFTFDAATFGGDPAPGNSKVGFYRCYIPLTPVTIPDLFNTGRGPLDGTQILGRFQPDPNYILTLTPQPITTPTPASVCWALGWASWNRENAWLGFGDSPSTERGVNQIQTTFDLTGFDPNTASLSVQFMAFNLLEDVILNGVSKGISMTARYTSFSTPFTILNGFQTGINTLAFRFSNISTSYNGTFPNAVRARFLSAKAVPYKLGRNIPSLFNTGQGLSTGSPDPHYTLTIPTTTPATVVSNSNWRSNDTDSGWIGFGVVSPIGNYQVQTTFDLTGFISNTTSLTIEISVDDSLVDIYLNGLSKGLSYGMYTPYTWKIFTINSGFQSGINTIAFRWYNGAGVTAIRVRISGTAVPI